MVELLRGIRHFAASYAFNLPAQVFIERVGAAREVQLPPELETLFLSQNTAKFYMHARKQPSAAFQNT